jgi:hypothetical protein
MSTLAFDRRILAWAAAPLLLLAACPDNTVTPLDETTAQTDTQTTASTTSTGPDDPSTSTGPEPTTTPMEESSTSTAVVDDSTTGGPTTITGPGTTGEISVCGNNIIEGDELCDLAQVNGETCESLGYQGGQLGCLLTCEDYNLLGCFICGNEVIDIAEDCEGGVVPEDVDCESLGFQDGFVTCGDDCLYDLSECSICGDGIQAGYEQCDGIDFGGSTCASVGFDGGNLACNLAECAFVYSGCFGGMYIQNFEASMNMPLELDVDVAAPWFVDEDLPINESRSARSGNLPAGGITNMTLMTSFPAPGNIAFMHREDTAQNFDYLRFYRNGVLQQSWSGNLAAQMYMAAVPAGNHTFQWRFERAGFANAGQNAVWVDDITLTGGVPL